MTYIRTVAAVDCCHRSPYIDTDTRVSYVHFFVCDTLVAKHTQVLMSIFFLPVSLYLFSLSHILRASHPPCLTSSIPHIISASHPPSLTLSIPKTLPAPHPLCLTSSLPHIIPASHPPFLTSSIPKTLSASHPPSLKSSLPHILPA